MTTALKSPYPYPGGKSDAAPEIWARLGVDVGNYCEPFCGSAAALLGRPGGAQGTETVNDLDGFIVNALRAITYVPDETAYWCDWPVSEADLTSIHLWLKAQRPDLTARLFGDPDYCDPKVAGRWLWGIASWIGDGWCVADGPWISVDGVLVDRRVVGEDVEGVTKKMPLISGRAGEGEITNGIQSLRRASVPRKMPEIGKSPNGQIAFNRKGVQAYRHHEGVPRQMPMVAQSGYGQAEKGVNIYAAPDALLSYFARLSDRLRRVRFLCGDWKRAVKDSVTINHGTTGVFLDPPYPAHEHSMEYHAEEAGTWHAAAEWAIAHGDDPRLRIAIAGYTSEAVDTLFPASWERYTWEARGGYANQSKDGRGRANAKRECVWFSPHCLKPAEEAKAAFSRPIVAKESDFAGTMFE